MTVEEILAPMGSIDFVGGLGIEAHDGGEDLRDEEDA